MHNKRRKLFNDESSLYIRKEWLAFEACKHLIRCKHVNNYVESSKYVQWVQKVIRTEKIFF